jgi:pyridinium-3,5-bisthiocarboxylic acid mononucleotide nickel chelatase
MNTLYFDCFSGVAGDMVLGALLGLGLDFEAWKQQLATLPLGGYRVARTCVQKGPLACTQVLVEVDEAGEPQHRRLHDVLDILDRAALPPPVRARAGAVFERLAAAEAAVHGATTETVAFHEVGAVDALVDITGAVLALHQLGIQDVVCSPVTVGRTLVGTAHGLLPTPAPATLELLRGVPIQSCDLAAELTTPTGAALMTTLSRVFGPPPSGRVTAIGYGAGTLDLEGRPNALRAIQLETEDLEPAAARSDRVAVLEANLDDMIPEHLGALQPLLLQAGALDVFVVPVTMKKGRPGWQLTVLAPLDRRAELAERMLRETTTFGVRFHEVQRILLQRRFVEVEVRGGNVRIKEGLLGEDVVTASPEYEDCARAARDAGVPLKTVYEEARTAYHQACSTRSSRLRETP